MTRGDQRLIQRGAAVAILLALAGLLWLGPAALYLDVLDDGARALERAQAVLAHDRALARRPSGASDGASGALLLPDGSEAEAVALLQGTLKTAADAAQVEIQGLQVLPSDTLAGAARIGIRLRARGDVAGLDRLLYSIAAARPLLYPDNLTVRAAATALEFQLDVSAFKPGAPS